MKVWVAVKRVVDYKVRVRVKSDHSGVDLQQVKMAVNPFDEIAVEAAVQLKEQNHAAEVVVISVGSAACDETLRGALALGADRAIRIDAADGLASLTVAQALAALAKTEAPDLILLGKQAIDSDANQTGQMLAQLLNRPQATFASKIKVDGEALQVTREIDGGLETLAVSLPAVVTTDLRLNEPRYPSLPNIMKAKSKPLQTTTLSELGVEPHAGLQVLRVKPPAERQAGRMVADVAELVSVLRDEQGVI